MKIKGYEIIVYPNLLTIVHGYGHGCVLHDAGTNMAECYHRGIRQALDFYINDANNPMWVYWAEAASKNYSAQMIDALRLRDRIQINKEQIEDSFTLYSSPDILQIENSPNTVDGAPIYDGAILSYRNDGSCLVNSFQCREADYSILFGFEMLPPPIV